ncbi:non-ribosomal peptide synthetase [Seonamhaeicola marinus]|uniref:Amino acid adenylation domain-containing protein n=1 Tax=Seonamhaeicola marinus TaxID=1912246 RepID=A0A5D0HTU5_9FLAO|nr:non-ribosomal peptide synthetase [Seonamhaeicola marinus]TYA74716.1 amino acid adenylation domain-containing protein [Seonamhaeicola marinus]
MNSIKADLLPLTKSQTALWLTDKLNEGLPVNNDAYIFHIKGNLQKDVFEIAFNKLVEVSDALRIVFEEKDNTPFQKILPYAETNFDFLDFTDTLQEDVNLWLNTRSNLVFDITKKLYDSVLIKLKPDHFIWFFNMHHLITDAASRSILFKRMSQIYEQLISSEEAIVVNENSFKTYLNFEQESRETNAKICQYWDDKVEGFGEALSLYGSKNMDRTQTLSKRNRLKINKDRIDTILKLASNPDIFNWNNDIVLYNVFATVLIAYLYKLSGQKDVIIGSPIHNRTNQKFKETAGLFMEIFPLNIEISENETFISLWKKVQSETIVSLEKGLPGTSSTRLNSSFNVLYNYINSGFSDFAGYKTVSEWMPPTHLDSGHHLRLQVHDFDNTGDVQLTFDLNSGVFDCDKYERVGEHFLNILDVFLENPNHEIENTQFISQAEILKLKSWNDTEMLFPEEEHLLTRFQKQVSKTPNAIALVFEEVSLTYKSLDEKSNQVARYLKGRGVTKNDIVAISLERSLEMMICIYGIVKMGAAYLPIDTGTPIDRLNYILKDAQVKALIYNHEKINLESLDFQNRFHVQDIVIQEGTPQFDAESVTILPNDLAYVIYTSGSTGNPKGVMCHHEGICNRLNWMNADYPITSKDTFIQKTPITFDVSLWELFWPLQQGAKLVIEVPDGHKNPEKLIHSIRKHKVTNIHFVPSMLNVFIENEEVEACESLKRIFCSGEALSAPIVKSVYNKLENVEVHNLYGPTEASVDVTSWYCDKQDLENGIPIGKSVANTELYILDKYLNQIPIGLVGELYIAGKQVAKGYLNNEALTAERFIDNPFSKVKSSKMYKTGDLARYREDGVIEYHGRTDNQVKLRGLRIELGEIEKNMEKHPAISQAVVVIDKDENLVGYYAGTEVETVSILNLLKQYLPDYMVPTFYKWIDGFELLSSGKVDRKKLLNIEVSKTLESKVSPRNEIEELIHEVWTEVLGIEDIGVNENFIRIGGNSLNAISITSRLKNQLELEVSITDVFNYSTIEAYAKYIEQTMIKLLGEEN